jgi:ubiquinone/menaquinone biosynthesis C-methylase UbiE
MANSGQSFREFEQAGWENPGVVTGYHEHLSSVTTQSTQALLDAAGIGDRSRVLDVATGAGYVASAAAERGAEPIGVDFSAAQVRMAREKYPTVRFEQADAEALPFEADTFDAVVNGFGMCHLSDPDLALREAFRVLKRGGRVAFSVWAAPERAVGIGAVYAAVRAHGSLDVGLPVGPNFFLFSDPEQSMKALRSAGFASPEVRQISQVLRMATPEKLFEVIAEGTVRAAAMLSAQSPPAMEAIRAALRETVAAYKLGDYYDLPMPAVVATAAKP